MRPRKLTEDEIRAIKKAYQQAHGYRGTVARLARQYGVSRDTILRALDTVLPSVGNSDKSPGSGTGKDPISGPLVGDSPGGVSDAFSCPECYAPNLLPGQSDHTRWCSRKEAA